ncbi:MAG TPA: hypothetical protein VMU27_02965 [Candidatus Paceibacterota bacterium]|nr:hypothetical protein [Candidatus Paceibacterota bacterium]
MSTHDRNSIIVGTIIIAIIFIGFFAWEERESSNASVPTATIATSTEASSTANIFISSNGEASTSSDYTIKQIPIGGKSPIAPNYQAPLVFPNTISADERSQMQSQFADIESTLSTTPQDFNAWIALGDLREEVGDYEGALSDWQYMSELYPTNIVSNANLADLYTNYLPNYPKAAAAYQAQIKNYPTDVYIYVDLYDLYTNQYPQSTSTIVTLLKQGLLANPGNAQLQSLLAKYQ